VSSPPGAIGRPRPSQCQLQAHGRPRLPRAWLRSENVLAQPNRPYIILPAHRPHQPHAGRRRGCFPDSEDDTGDVNELIHLIRQRSLSERNPVAMKIGLFGGGYDDYYDANIKPVADDLDRQIAVIQSGGAHAAVARMQDANDGVSRRPTLPAIRFPIARALAAFRTLERRHIHWARLPRLFRRWARTSRTVRHWLILRHIPVSKLRLLRHPSRPLAKP
jgi:hypothetical protein